MNNLGKIRNCLEPFWIGKNKAIRHLAFVVNFKDTTAPHFLRINFDCLCVLLHIIILIEMIEKKTVQFNVYSECLSVIPGRFVFYEVI